MKKIYKLFLMTAIVFGMVACSNDDVPEAPESLKGNTYASIEVTLPKTVSTRALPGDYNDIGEWKGIDAIETVTVFLVGETTVDHTSFSKANFNGITEAGVLNPKLAVKATTGTVKAYVVLNGNEDILTTLKEATASNFATVYTTEFAKNASEVAKNNGEKDVIMMTNTVEPVAVEIKAGVTEEQARIGEVNKIKVDVERVVSRAIVTVKEGAEKTIQLKSGSGVDASSITISDLKYVVGQSNTKFFLTKKTTYETPEDLYSFVPSTSTPWTGTYFDNTGLGYASTVEEAEGSAIVANFTTALIAEKVNSKFVLPVTHLDDNYRKGNTTYFEVTAIFTPDKVDGVAYTPGSDVYFLASDGLFYSTRESAEANGQNATHYKADGTNGVIMKYVLWLNPDKVPGATTEKATMSPTVRNQVYHAHITGFKQIGLPNNPLNPDDPNNPQVKDPTDPGYDPADPTKPKDPTDPGYNPDIPGNENPINPIKPTDPLQTEDTYLSVEIKVLPWGIHSYGINLGNDY